MQAFQFLYGASTGRQRATQTPNTSPKKSKHNIKLNHTQAQNIQTHMRMCTKGAKTGVSRYTCLKNPNTCAAVGTVG